MKSMTDSQKVQLFRTGASAETCGPPEMLKSNPAQVLIQMLRRSKNIQPGDVIAGPLHLLYFTQTRALSYTNSYTYNRSKGV